MKTGQKSKRNNVEDLLCPYTDLRITQGSHDTYSHAGSTAIDVIGIESGVKYAYYAPCKMKCVNIDLNYAFTWWQSVEKVRFADGTINYATIMIGHDEDINAKIGTIIEQGVQIANMGAGAKATGVHSHLEVAKGQETTWVENSDKVWVLPNEVEFETAFFMDNTNIIYGFADWKYLKDVPVVIPIDYQAKYNEEVEKNRTLTTENYNLKGTIKQNSDKIAELNTEVAKLNLNVESDKAKIDNLTNLVSSKDNEVLILKQENVLLEENIEELDKEIADKELQYQVELSKKDKTISDKDLLIANLKKEDYHYLFRVGTLVLYYKHFDKEK